MTRLEEIIANALAGIPETDAAILAREVVRLMGEQAVVVPEPTMFDVNREYFERFATAFTSPHAREAHKTGFLAGVDWFRERARAIPADRALGERRVAVDREELEALRFLHGRVESWRNGVFGVTLDHVANASVAIVAMHPQNAQDGKGGAA